MLIWKKNSPEGIDEELSLILYCVYSGGGVGRIKGGKEKNNLDWKREKMTFLLDLEEEAV